MTIEVMRSGESPESFQAIVECFQADDFVVCTARDPKKACLNAARILKTLALRFELLAGADDPMNRESWAEANLGLAPLSGGGK